MTSPATVEELRDVTAKFYEMLSALPRVCPLPTKTEQKKAA